MRKSPNFEEFSSLIEELNPNLVVSNYTKMDNNVDVYCKVCGGTFARRGSRLTGNPKCPFCNGTYKRSNVTDEMFKQDIAKISPNIKILGKYKKRKSPVQCQCKIDGNIWMETPDDLYRGRGCPECKKEKLREMYQFSKDEILEKLNSVNPKSTYEIPFYQNVNSIVKCKCPDCGNFWETQIINIIYSKSGCPSCNSSKGEKEIRRYLEENHIRFEEQKKFEDCRGHKRPLPFDFYLEDYKMLIEFQGIEHYKSIPFFGGDESFENRKALDGIKKDYAINNGYKFLEISYIDLKKGNVNDILAKNIRR